MYYIPGVSNPYGLPMPKKRRGRRSDLSKFLERQGDLFLAALILAGPKSPAFTTSEERKSNHGKDSR